MTARKLPAPGGAIAGDATTRSGIPLATPLTAWLLACFALPLAIVLLLSLQQSSELFAPLVVVAHRGGYEKATR